MLFSLNTSVLIYKIHHSLAFNKNNFSKKVISEFLLYKHLAKPEEVYRPLWTVTNGQVMEYRGDHFQGVPGGFLWPKIPQNPALLWS